MEHAFIDDHDLVARYVAGRLSTAEMREFEAHFIDCAACLERLEVEQDFRAGLLETAAALPRAARGTRALPIRRVMPATLAAAAAVVLAAGMTIAYVQARRQLDATLVRTATLERDDTQVHARADALDAQLHARGSRPSRIAVVELDSVRTAGRSRFVPSVTIASSTSLIVLSLAVANPADYSRLSASIDTSSGTEEVRVDDLRPASPTSVAFAVDASNLSSGDYTIVLEGAIRNRPPSVIARYPLHVTRG